MKCSVARTIQVYAYQDSGISISGTHYFVVSAVNVYERFSFTTTIKNYGTQVGLSTGDIAFYDSTAAQTYYIKKPKDRVRLSRNRLTPASEDLGIAGTTTINGGNIITGVISSANGYSTLNLNNGTFSFGNGALAWNGSALTAKGTFEAVGGSQIAKMDGGSFRLINGTTELGYSVYTVRFCYWTTTQRCCWREKCQTWQNC